MNFARFLQQYANKRLDSLRQNTVEFVLCHSAVHFSENVLIGDLLHHGRKGQKWGVRNGPPYPLSKKVVKRKYSNLSVKKIPTITQTVSDRPKWSKAEQKEPFDYWSMQDDKAGYPRHLKPIGFSSDATLNKHFEDHGKKMGFATKEEYQQAGIDYFQSPRGKNGDAHVKQNGDACRYDYGTGEYAVVTKSGKLKTYWNLLQDKTTTKAESYWRKQKNE